MANKNTKQDKRTKRQLKLETENLLIYVMSYIYDNFYRGSRFRLLYDLGQIFFLSFAHLAK